MRFRWALLSALPSARFSSFHSQGFPRGVSFKGFFHFFELKLLSRAQSRRCAIYAAPRMPTWQSTIRVGSVISCASGATKPPTAGNSLSRVRWCSELAARVHESNGEGQGHQTRAKKEARGGAHQGRSGEASSVCILWQQR